MGYEAPPPAQCPSLQPSSSRLSRARLETQLAEARQTSTALTSQLAKVRKKLEVCEGDLERSEQEVDRLRKDKDDMKNDSFSLRNRVAALQLQVTLIQLYTTTGKYLTH